MIEVEVKIKPYSKTELANMYSVSVHILKVWLEPFKDQIGEYKGRIYTVKQIELIFECLGKP